MWNRHAKYKKNRNFEEIMNIKSSEHLLSCIMWQRRIIVLHNVTEVNCSFDNALHDVLCELLAYLYLSGCIMKFCVSFMWCSIYYGVFGVVRDTYRELFCGRCYLESSVVSHGPVNSSGSGCSGILEDLLSTDLKIQES